MKALSVILKIVAALAAIAGAVYVIATYGDKIVAWAKGLLNKCTCCCGEDCCCDEDCCCEDGECCCDEDCDCQCCCGEEEVAEEAAEEVAEEADFEN